MLVFIDESGDPGMNLEGGASEFFVVTAVSFQEEEHAVACCKRISTLRTEAGLPARIELHFAKSSDKVRHRLLRGVASSNFFYRSVVIDKKKIDPSVVPKGRKSFHQYAVGLVLESWRANLIGATVDVDKGGGESFSRSLCRYVSQNFKDRDGKPLLKRVRTCDSKASNLMQLADMVCGAVARSFKPGAENDEFRKLVKPRELEVIVRP